MFKPLKAVNLYCKCQKCTFKETAHFSHTMYLCASYDSHKKTAIMALKIFNWLVSAANTDFCFD